MAEKEVQISKSSAVSTAPSGKKTTTTSSKAPLSSTQTTMSSTSAKTSHKESSDSPPLRELADILRELNSNVNAQSERLDKQSQRIDDIMKHWNEDSHSYEDCHYDEYDNEEEYDCHEQLDSDSLTDPSGSENKEPSSIFKRLSNKFQQSEQVDVDVHPDLASLVNNSFRNGLSEDNLEDILKQISRPENCDSLVKTSVNQGIWRLLKSFTQSEDSRLTAIQGVLLKASINIVKLLEKLGQTNSDHVELGTTAIALLGHANKMINTKRKDLHKSDLDYKYHYLASASLPYTDLLYGNDTDVNNNVREINNMNRIGKSSGRGGGPMKNRGRGRRGNGSPYPSRGRGFRGRGRGASASGNEVFSSNQTKNFKQQRK